MDPQHSNYPSDTVPTTLPHDRTVVNNTPSYTIAEHAELQGPSIPLAQTPVLSTVRISVKASVMRFVNSLCHLHTRIREISIGNSGFEVNLNTEPVEAACYIEYISANHCWRASVHPSGIPLRGVGETELTPGCRQLVNDAGCVFKTRESTDLQDSKPIEIPSRLLRSIMQSLCFCEVYRGTLYRVYKSRFGRPINFIVTIFAHVSVDGQNQIDHVYAPADTLVMKVELTNNESVAAVVQILKGRDKNYGISKQGREVVKSKLRGQHYVRLE